MYRKNRWKVWQMIRSVGASGEVMALMRKANEKFPPEILQRQIENLRKLGFFDAAGVDIAGLVNYPGDYAGVSGEASLPAYLVIPEHIVSLAKQCELLKIDCRLDIYNIANRYPTTYPERIYWIFEVEVHGAEPVHKDCKISDLESADRCGLTLIEGLALIRESGEVRNYIKWGNRIAFPGSLYDGRYPILRLPYANIEKIKEGREFRLDIGLNVENEMEEYQGLSELSKTMIASRAIRIIHSGACRTEHPNR